MFRIPIVYKIEINALKSRGSHALTHLGTMIKK